MKVFVHNLASNKEMSSTTATILIISAIVVVVLALSFYIGIHIWARMLRKKYDKKAMKEAIIKIESLRNNIGVIPLNLKSYFNSKENDYDVEGMINTIYQNDYKQVLVISQDLYSFGWISQTTQNPLFYELESFDFERYNQARLQTDLNLNKQIVPHQNENLDFVAIFSASENLNDLYDRYFKLLNHNGMIAIKITNFKKSELKLLLKHLAFSKIQHEISYFGTKILFIVKKEIN
ncbi:BC85_0335 family putative methyltransferase [Mycoplasmopsis gallopavonis]|uniref:Uncharacterized protein n=1 Tax=Mycoplasmopsis gallopavonis TaxID=76629 RepID=A0A449AZ84_9BACT|nr:hypothetical protein [Mycoplasmopsis gallopavonis]RIV16440.1 hypothetical protein D1113_02345 [Mycoplasmopsis gallopavonis]VEU72833.1 Uncharacterised protein [Mycoplasmopsis gallopavonis]